MKYQGWPYRAYIKTAKNGDFCEELRSENDSQAVLATFCRYDHGVRYKSKRVLQMLLVCYNLLNSPNISVTVKKGWLHTRTLST